MELNVNTPLLATPVVSGALKDSATRSGGDAPRSAAESLGNRLLASLPNQSNRYLFANCDLVDLEFGKTLFEAGAKIRHVYFPVDSFVSLVTTLDDGNKLEVGLIGDEGMVGLSLVLGVEDAPQKIIVQGAGRALRMSAAAFLHHYERNNPLQSLLRRYLYVLMSQLSQTAACTHYHRLEARLARWLLTTRDRAHSDTFRLTHKFLAYMLGVRRVGVTEAAGTLHRRRMINHTRGNIVILDGPALERAACVCYSDAKRMYERTMPLRAKNA